MCIVDVKVYNVIFIDLTMVPLYMVAIASYHSGAHLMKPRFPVKLQTTLSQGCHISYNLVTTLQDYY